MPIVGNIAGKECITFDLTDEQALATRDLYHRSPELVTVPCCGHQAFLRQSVLGLWHFVHRDTTGCEYVGDAPEVMWLKYLAYRVAREAGWDVALERRGEGWYADVVCGTERWKVALQLFRSGRRLAKRAEEQTALKAAGLRGAWFVKSLPADYTPAKDLPMFLIEEGWRARERRPPLVAIDGDELPFGEAVRALLETRIQFRERRETRGPLRVVVAEVAMLCPPCGHDYVLVPVLAYQQRIAHGGAGAPPPGVDLMAALRATLAAWRLAGDHGDHGAVVAARDERGGPIAQVTCPDCRRPVPRWQVLREAQSQVRTGRSSGIFPSLRGFDVDGFAASWRDPHWCLREADGQHCPSLGGAPSTPVTPTAIETGCRGGEDDEVFALLAESEANGDAEWRLG